jgi:hypothetical protein
VQLGKPIPLRYLTEGCAGRSERRIGQQGIHGSNRGSLGYRNTIGPVAPELNEMTAGGLPD